VHIAAHKEHVFAQWMKHHCWRYFCTLARLEAVVSLPKYTGQQVVDFKLNQLAIPPPNKGLMISCRDENCLAVHLAASESAWQVHRFLFLRFDMTHDTMCGQQVDNIQGKG
jgi:hypothetical protein